MANVNCVADEVLQTFSYQDGDRIDPLKLEQSLCHVLMDKALLNCLLLLDKADMESRMKTLTVHQTQFDYSGMFLIYGDITFELGNKLKKTAMFRDVRVHKLCFVYNVVQSFRSRLTLKDLFLRHALSPATPRTLKS